MYMRRQMLVSRAAQLTYDLLWTLLQLQAKQDETSKTSGSSLQVQVAEPASQPPATSTEGLEYADLNDAKAPKCLLCQRQFKSLDVIRKHSLQSELHKVG